MPRTNVVLYRDDGRVPPKEIDRAVEHRAKFEKQPEQYTHEEA